MKFLGYYKTCHEANWFNLVKILPKSVIFVILCLKMSDFARKSKNRPQCEMKKLFKTLNPFFAFEFKNIVKIKSKTNKIFEINFI